MLLIVSLNFILILLLILPKIYKTLIVERFFVLNLLGYLFFIAIQYFYFHLPLVSDNTILLFDGLLGINRVVLLNEILLLITAILLLNITPLYNSYNLNKNSRIEGEIYLILLGGLIGMILMLNSKDWIITILSLQLINISIYFLLSLNKNSEKTLSGGFKYLLLSALASTLILLGIAFLYSLTGSTNYENIYIINSYLNDKLLLPFLLILIGIFFKLGSAPFHQWLPDLYDCLPLSLVLWFATLPKITLLGFLLNIIPILNYYKLNYILNILLILGILSIIIGNIGMGYQYRIKRFLAYSSISHLGLLFLALSHLDLNNYYIYYWVYMLTTVNIFLILIVILKGPINNNNNLLFFNDLIYLNQLKGLFLINKPLTIGLGINLLSLAGIPPLAGFFTKALIFISLINLSDWISALFIIITSTIGTAYYIKLYKILNLDNNNYNQILLNSNQFILIPNTFIAYLISFLTIFLIFFMFKPLFLFNHLAYSIF